VRRSLVSVQSFRWWEEAYLKVEQRHIFDPVRLEEDVGEGLAVQTAEAATVLLATSNDDIVVVHLRTLPVHQCCRAGFETPVLAISIMRKFSRKSYNRST